MILKTGLSTHFLSYVLSLKVPSYRDGLMPFFRALLLNKSMHQNIGRHYSAVFFFVIRIWVVLKGLQRRWKICFPRIRRLPYFFIL